MPSLAPSFLLAPHAVERPEERAGLTHLVLIRRVNPAQLGEVEPLDLPRRGGNPVVPPSSTRVDVSADEGAELEEDEREEDRELHRFGEAGERRAREWTTGPAGGYDDEGGGCLVRRGGRGKRDEAFPVDGS